MTNFQKNCQIVAKCEHEFYSTLCKVCTWVLLNTLLQFHKFFLTLCIFVVFYNVNTVRSEMWVWGFPNHSCQKFLTNHSSSTRDLTRFLAFVIWKTPYSHFLLTVFSHFFQNCGHFQYNICWHKSKVNWCYIENDHNYERNEEHATYH